VRKEKMHVSSEMVNVPSYTGVTASLGNVFTFVYVLRIPTISPFTDHMNPENNPVLAASPVPI
jgi:hypothetical protein